MSATLERGIHAFLEQVDAPTALFFSTCVRCGVCADACEFYVDTGDPKYTPINKLRPFERVWRQNYSFWGKLGKALGLTRPITDQELAEWELLIYDGCTMCGRCSMVCPVGNDITYMIRKAREGFAASGHTPEGQRGAVRRTVEKGSPMGVSLQTLQAQIAHIEKATGLTIPLDVVGADYMVMLSSMETVNFPEYLEALVRIFKQAGITWTINSDYFEATNAGHQLGSSDIAAELVERIVKGAEKLRVKYVISPECGHAYYALRWEGPNVIGRPFPFKVVHIMELLDQLRSEGRFKTEGVEQDRLTFHDPCQVVRRGGVVEEPRRLLNMVAPNFVEMREHGKMNWCCGGGGGVSANERAEPLRLKSFKTKKVQLEELKVDVLVTACANCRIMLEEGLEHYSMELPVVGLTEMLAAHLVEDGPESVSGED